MRAFNLALACLTSACNAHRVTSSSRLKEPAEHVALKTRAGSGSAIDSLSLKRHLANQDSSEMLQSLLLTFNPGGGTRRRELVFAALASATLPRLASAKSGEWTNFDQETSGISVGDSTQECLFEKPGTGVCIVYKSDDPPLVDGLPITDLLAAIAKGTEKLNVIPSLIANSQWSPILQTLGEARDMKESIALLNKEVFKAKGKYESKKMNTQTKEVFAALNDIQAATMAKDQQLAKLSYDKFVEGMAILFPMLTSQFA